MTKKSFSQKSSNLKGDVIAESNILPDASLMVVPDEREQSVPYTKAEDALVTEEEFLDLEETGEVGELAVDVFHNDNEIVVVAPIAGITSKDFSINVVRGVLTIRGRRAFSFDVSPQEYVTQECFWGAFTRNIILPDHVDVTKIKASFKNGVLAVRIPKLKPLEVKVVAVEG